MPNTFQVRPVDEKAERRSKLKRWSLIASAAVLALAGAGFAAWYFAPPPMPQNVEQAQALLSSARFERLSKSDKQPYYDTIREQFGSLDRAERRRLMEEDEKLRDAMGQAWRSTMEAWGRQWIIASEEERAAMEGLWNRGRGNRNRGNDDQNQRRERQERQERESRPEMTEAQKAERRNRGMERMSDFMANGNAQSSQIIGEMFWQRRQAREQDGR